MRLKFLLIFVLAFSGGALAEQGNSPCREDAEKYCAQSGSEKGKVMDCLLDHQNDVSDACYDSMKSRMENQHGMQACKADVKALCAGEQPGGGRIVACLKQHQKELSDDCYDFLSKKMKQRKS